MGARMGLAGQAEQGERLAELADAVGVEQRGGELVGEPDALHEPAPGLVDVSGRLVLGQPPDDLGRLHQRVVGPQRLRSVSGGAAHGEGAPEGALLPGDDGQSDPAVRTLHREPARLGHEVVAAHLVGEMLGQPLGSVGAQRLLVRHAEEHEVAAGAEPGAGQMAEGHCHRRGEVQHVDGAAAPDLAVDQLAAERVVPPVVGVGGDDVGVPEQRQRRRVAVASFELGH